MANKMTNSKALEFVLSSEDITLPTEVREKLVNIKASIDKKNSGERKETATQKENKAFKEIIVAYLTETGKAQTISEIIKGCPDLAELSNQRVSAIVRQLKDDNIVVRTEDKRKAYFSIA